MVVSRIGNRNSQNERKEKKGMPPDVEVYGKGPTSGLCGLVVSYYRLTQKNVMALGHDKDLQYPHTESDQFIGSKLSIGG
jgi:hypothetical protein